MTAAVARPVAFGQELDTQLAPGMVAVDDGDEGREARRAPTPYSCRL